MTYEERDQMTAEEYKIINLLKGKSRADQDQILFEIERKSKNGNTI